MNRRSKSVLVPSITTRDKLIEQGFNNVVHWGRGFNETIFNTKNKNNPNKKHLLYVGRVSIEKNLHDLLKLSNEYNVSIVGDGPDRKKLEKEYLMLFLLDSKKVTT